MVCLLASVLLALAYALLAASHQAYTVAESAAQAAAASGRRSICSALRSTLGVAAAMLSLMPCWHALMWQSFSAPQDARRKAWTLTSCSGADALCWGPCQHMLCLQAHGFSEEASFVAAPPVGPDAHVSFLAIADMGQAEIDGSNEQSEMLPALNTTMLMTAEAADKQLLIHNGDISYARSVASSPCMQQGSGLQKQLLLLCFKAQLQITQGQRAYRWLY